MVGNPQQEKGDWNHCDQFHASSRSGLLFLQRRRPRYLWVVLAVAVAVEVVEASLTRTQAPRERSGFVWK